MVIIPGPASRELGEKIASLINQPSAHPVYKTFPDGESYIRLTDDLSSKDVAIVQTTYPDQEKRLLELVFLTRAAKDMGARSVTAVVPYLAYARQDKRFAAGESVSIDAVLKIIESAGADRLLTVDIHKEEVLKRTSIPARNISAANELAKHLQFRDHKPELIIAPDMGAYQLAQRVAEPLGAACDFLDKRRDRETGEILTAEKEISVEETVAIVDDMISTGSSISNTAAILKKNGARRIYAYCIHPLLVAGAVGRMKDAGVEEVVGTDTVPSSVSLITVADILAEAVKESLRSSSS